MWPHFWCLNAINSGETKLHLHWTTNPTTYAIYNTLVEVLWVTSMLYTQKSELYSTVNSNLILWRPQPKINLVLLFQILGTFLNKKFEICGTIILIIPSLFVSAMRILI